MAGSNGLVALTAEQKRFFDDNGFLTLRGLYSEAEMAEMRREFHDLITNTEDRPKAMRYDFMPPDPEYPIDPYNPKNVRGIMDQPLANEYWFNNVTDPRKDAVDRWGNKCAFAGLPLARGGKPVIPQIRQQATEEGMRQQATGNRRRHEATGNRQR